MDAKIIPFPVSSQSTIPSQINYDEADEAEVIFSCSVMALDFANGKSITTICEEWGLEEWVVLDAIRSDISRMCSTADLQRYQAAIAAEC